METKKNAKANLENKRFRFFQLGLICSLSLVLFAFEWKSREAKQSNKTSEINTVETIEIDQIINYTKKINPPKKKFSTTNIISTSPDLHLENVFRDKTKDVKSELETIELVDEEEEEGGEIMFTPLPQEMPYFEDCWNLNKRFQEECTRQKIDEFIRKNQNFPTHLGLRGTFEIVFYIGTKGDIIRTEITNSIHPKYDAEAERLIKSLPEFEPGKQGGRPAIVRYKLPITIKV